MYSQHTSKKQSILFLRILEALILAMLIWLVLAFASHSQNTKASQPPDGSKLFQQYCSKCHLAGENLVKMSKPLSSSEKLANLAIFKTYLMAPPGHMPFYKNVINDQKVLQALYNYCKTLDAKKSKISMAKVR